MQKSYEKGTFHTGFSGHNNKIIKLKGCNLVHLILKNT